jgi:AAA15 family ATPase/GTPase
VAENMNSPNDKNNIELPEIFCFPGEVSSNYECSPGIDKFLNLSKVNIFVGANNSGKSRLMRKMFTNSNNYKYIDDSQLIQKMVGEYFNFISRSHMKWRFFINKQGYINKIDQKGNKIQQGIDIKESSKKFIILIGEIKKEINEQGLNNGLSKGDINDFNNNIGKVNLKIEEVLKSYPKTKIYQIYIPVLRGLRPLFVGENEKEKKDGASEYSERTRHDYFREWYERKKKFIDVLDDGQKINTGLEFFNTIRTCLLGERKYREHIRNYEIFLSEIFFENKEITLIPKEGEDVLTLKIGNEKERPIYNLGDGLQQLLIITYSIYHIIHDTEKKNVYFQFFIEEPELYMHPGLQRILLNLFTSDKFPNVQFFFTTHSNHMLEMTQEIDNISIYRFTKKALKEDHDDQIPKFQVDLVSHGDHNLLSCLGVSNASVFLSNCTIWVEGITDRLYFRKYLELYQEELQKKSQEKLKQYEEDLHYSFVEYSGNNITHWSFLDKEENPINAEALCGKIFLISDKDNGKEKRHEALEKTLKERFHCLESLEIENLLSPDVLYDVIESYKGQGEINREENLSHSDYQKKYLGNFIDEEILKIGKEESNTISRSFSAKSGTIKNKLDFAKKAINFISYFKDLTEEAQKLTRKIYEFIERNNSY